MFLDRVIPFRETLGDQVKGRSPKKLEWLIEVPKVVHVKVHVLSFNMILISSQLRVLKLSYPFLQELEGKGKVSDPKKAGKVNNGDLSMRSKSTCSKCPYNPSPIAVACS